MKKSLLKMTLLVLLAGAFATGCATSPDNHATASPANAALIPYPLDYCLVSGDKLGAMGKPIVMAYQGQEIKFCCPDCPPEFKKDPDKYMKKLQAAVAEKK